MPKSDPPKKDSIEYYKKKYGVSGFNSPKRTPNHPTKSHIVVVKVGDKIRVIRFGQQGVSGEGKASKETVRKKRIVVNLSRLGMPKIFQKVRCPRPTGQTK